MSDAEMQAFLDSEEGRSRMRKFGLLYGSMIPRCNAILWDLLRQIHGKPEPPCYCILDPMPLVDGARWNPAKAGVVK